MIEKRNESKFLRDSWVAFQSTLSLALLLKLPFVVWAGSVYLHFGPSVCSVTLCSGIRLLCTDSFGCSFLYRSLSLLLSGQETPVSYLNSYQSLLLHAKHTKRQVWNKKTWVYYVNYCSVCVISSCELGWFC